MKPIKSLLFMSVTCVCGISFGQTSEVEVKVVDKDNQAIAYVSASIDGTNEIVLSDEKGILHFDNLKYGSYTLNISNMGYTPNVSTLIVDEPKEYLRVALEPKTTVIEEIEVFGERNKKPKGIEMITRLPIKPSDNIQTVSVISNKVIQDQGALTITDAVKNIPGVTLFGSYGGVKESMSTRGFRGIPVLKNGIRMDSQFQTASGVVDMQGVESIQMIKGSAAITQGVITDIGNAGGVINVVTKTPNFYDSGNVAIRYGSWNQFRPTFDIQQTLNKQGSVAVRFNGAYERADSYRKIVNANRVYFNPSLAWKASEKTTIIVESDYFNDNRTPHSSAINLAADQGTNALYVLPNDKFLGFRSDNNNTKMTSFMARIDHEINDLFKVRAAYGTSSYQVENIATSAKAAFKDKDFNLLNRSLTKSLRDDQNSTFQFDFIGENLKTGSLKHIAQIGFDYRTAFATTTSFETQLDGKKIGVIDQIDVMGNYSNDLYQIPLTTADGKQLSGSDIKFKALTPVVADYETFGVLAQDVIEFNKYLKAFLGIRYSEIYVKDVNGTASKRQSAWNPSLGLMVSPIKNINLFGSYTNSTSLRSASNLMNDGSEIGASTTEQYETGFKTQWLDNRLQFNLTYFHIFTSNLSNKEYIAGTDTTTGYYFKAGDLVRDGIEAELSGRVTDELTLMLGYAYLDARYENSPSYVNGSAPMNAPEHTANSWIQYNFGSGKLSGLSLSAGIYYVGKRPVNEFSLAPDGHGNMGGIEPFDMPAYTTLNAQIGYTYKSIVAKVFLNNITDEIGLNSYFRGGYINQIDPRNMAVSVGYNF